MVVVVVCDGYSDDIFFNCAVCYVATVSFPLLLRSVVMVVVFLFGFVGGVVVFCFGIGSLSYFFVVALLVFGGNNGLWWGV